jgi:hypothetical protein
LDFYFCYGFACVVVATVILIGAVCFERSGRNAESEIVCGWSSV